eukprot:1713182-Pleurochrysis_carterae.AAC.1
MGGQQARSTPPHHQRTSQMGKRCVRFTLFTREKIGVCSGTLVCLLSHQSPSLHAPPCKHVCLSARLPSRMPGSMTSCAFPSFKFSAMWPLTAALYLALACYAHLTLQASLGNHSTSTPTASSWPQLRR